MPWYSLFYLVAIVGGCAAMFAEARRRRFAIVRWTICVAAWAIGGVFGAVLPAIVLGELAATRTAVGAVAGATVALAIAASLLRIRIDDALDTTAIAIPIGGALARLGCFVADCCQGIVTSLPVGVVGDDGLRRHPTQLYEAVVDVAIAVWLTRPVSQRFRNGHRFLISLGLLSAGRFAIEFVRDSERLGPLSLAQWIVGPVALVCLASVARRVELPRFTSPSISRLLAASAGALFVYLSATGQLGALEASTILLVSVCCFGFVAARNGRLAPAGAAALMLQMPASADSTFPQRFNFWGIGAGGGSYRAFHDDSSCDSGPFAEWSRFHKYYGGSIEGGYLRQGSQWSGIGLRGRLSYSIDEADHAIATAGTAPNPKSYSTKNYAGAGYFDFIGKYGALTLGGAVGHVRPSLAGIFEDSADPIRAWEGYPAFGVRLGPLFGPSIEARFGDEAPLNVAAPMFTLALAGGDAQGNRIRLGISDGGVFASATLKRANGLDLMPSIHFLDNDRKGGGMAVRQWTRLP